MVSREAVVNSASGLHLKPAAVFSQEAAKYKSIITFTVNDYTANAKSVLSVLAACVKPGEVIEIVCSGQDEEEALQNLCDLTENGLGECI